MKPRDSELAGWGGHPTARGTVLESEQLEPITESAVLSRGLGRAYGDAALPPEGSDRPLARTVRADRLLEFDADRGVLRAEAGLSLADLNRWSLPRGWFTPVSPGTQFVTLGGMVAADVHGKNHHVAGCFGRHVRALRMRVGDGRVLEVTREGEPELFAATLGGMGLTGHVLEVAFTMERIPSPWIYEESERLPELEAVLESLAPASAAWPMTMAWIDTSVRGAALGRGIVIAGRWAEPGEAPTTPPKPRPAVPLPFALPSGLLNPTTLRLANAFWYFKHGSKKRRHTVHPEPFFYPLDAILGWNRAYGRRGFTQHQCVLPSEPALFRELLETLQHGGGASFVTVLKDCGAAGEGPLSFPQPGTSLALDIPITAGTPALIHRLNELVIQNGGRVYLAKDAFSSGGELRSMYPRLDEWREIRRKWDPEGRLDSAQAQRLLGGDT